MPHTQNEKEGWESELWKLCCAEQVGTAIVSRTPLDFETVKGLIMVHRALSRQEGREEKRKEIEKFVNEIDLTLADNPPEVREVWRLGFDAARQEVLSALSPEE